MNPTTLVRNYDMIVAQLFHALSAIVYRTLLCKTPWSYTHIFIEFENNKQYSDTCETDQSALQGDGSSGAATDPVVPISLEGGPQPTLVMGATKPPRPPENKRIDLGQV